MENEAKQKLQKALSENPAYKGKFYFGVKKGNKKNGNHKVTDKQRKIAHLSSRHKYELIQLHKELDQVMIANSNVTRGGDPNKQSKKDARKGKHSLEVHGIWSSVTFEKYMKSNRTFLKYCFENFGVKRLRDIKPKHVGVFIQTMLDRNLSAKTISLYVSSIKKLAESTVKAGVKSHINLVNYKHRAMVPIARKSERRRAGSHGGVGYTYREAQILIKAAGKHFSLYEQILIELFTFSGPRLSEILKLSFDQVDYENKIIIMNKKNQNKNNRPRVIPVSESTLEKLKILEQFFPNKQTRIWGHRMSERQVRGLVKECAKLGKIGYKGVHDLRKACVEFHLKRMSNDPKWTKEKLVNEIMKYVDSHPKLNPTIRRDGILQPKYVPEQLIQRQKRWLINQYLSQLLGHSRQDASCPYKRT